MTEGLFSQLHASLKLLQIACMLPSYYNLADTTQDSLHERQAEIDGLLKLYQDQITKDYNACRFEKENLVMFAHLSQQLARLSGS